MPNFPLIICTVKHIITWTLRLKCQELDSKAGLLTHIAVELYKQAAVEAPNDATPLSNLSAAHFELGDYHSCISSIDDAQKLTPSDELHARLDLRAIKALFLPRRYKDARRRVSSRPESGTDEERYQINEVCMHAAKVRSSIDASASRRKIVQVSPEYKPLK